MEQYDVDPKLDMTADCAGTPGDRLGASYVSTSIPNWGVQIKNDCGQSSVREEVDLHIWTATLWAETPYYYRVYYEVAFPQWNHGDLYSYAVEQAADGTVNVTVWVDFDDMDVRARYVEANKALAERLIAGKKGQVPVTVTFLRALPLSEAKAIIEASGMEVTAVGLDAFDTQGTKTTIVGIPRSGQFLDELELSQVILQPGGYILKGAMVLSGEVEAMEEGLGRLLDCEEIYLVDVMAAEVRELVATQLNKIVSDISVFTPSPHWLISVETE